MIHFLNFLTDEQLLAIYETIERAVLRAVLVQETLAQINELRTEEQQIVNLLSQRGQSETQVALYRSIRTELFAAWQQAKAAQLIS